MVLPLLVAMALSARLPLNVMVDELAMGPAATVKLPLVVDCVLVKLGELALATAVCSTLLMRKVPAVAEVKVRVPIQFSGPDALEFASISCAPMNGAE